MTLSIRRIQMIGAAAVLATAILVAGSAGAVPVPVTLTGHLTAVPTALSGVFSPGESFSFTYTYQSNTGNAGGASNAIYYYDSSHLDVGTGTFTVDVPAGAVFANAVHIVNTTSFDIYQVEATDHLVYSPAAAIAPYVLTQVLIQFTYGASTFSGPALPSGAPPYTSANSFNMQFRLDPGSVDGRIFVTGVIDSVSHVTAPIPAPATLALLLPGAALAGLLGRRRCR